MALHARAVLGPEWLAKDGAPTAAWDAGAAGGPLPAWLTGERGCLG